MIQRFKQWMYKTLGKDPDAVVVCFRSGDDALADAMCAEIRTLLPERRVIEATLADVPTLRQKLGPYRIGLAPTLFTGDPKFTPLQRVAWMLAPHKILAYNPRLERHHLRLAQPIASWLFLRGVSLDRIFLRPWWLWPRFLKRPNDRSERPAVHRVIEGRAKTQRPTIAVLSPYSPYPLSHGGAVRMFHLLRETAREFDVILYAFSEGTEAEIADADLAPVLEFVSRVVLVPKPRYREPRWSSLAPPEVCEYHSPEMLRLWREADSALKQVEYTYLAPYSGDVLVEHDVTFDLYAQILARKKAAREPSLSARWDSWRWQHYERRAVERFPAVVAMSEKDAHQLAVAHVRVIENGVDLTRFTPSPERPGRRLLFIGSFRHFPNIVAFRFLIEEIFPLIPDAELTVVAGPDALLHWRNHTGTLAPPTHPNIEIHQFVADVRPLYHDANVVVVPTRESAGTNVKVLEALAMERVVVGTPSGCAGLGLVHGETAWIAETAGELAAGIRHLLDDLALRLHISRAGRQHAERHFDWRAIGARQRALYRQLLGDPIQVRAATPEDLPAIAAIQASSPEASQWEARDYLTHDCRLALLDGRAAGFLAVRETAPGEREILNLAVDPAERRRGVARRLLGDALTDAFTTPAAWFLEVRESNTAALQLYKSLGFNIAGRRENYYHEPSEGAIVMRFLS